MKKILLGLIVFVVFGFVLGADRYYHNQRTNVLSWGHGHGLTSYNTLDLFRPSSFILREESTKFFVQAYESVFDVRVPLKSNTSCNFLDLNSSDLSLTSYIRRSCELGIFQGSNNRFFPKSTLSNAEAVAVIIRMTDGYMDESGSLWFQRYYDKLYEYANINSKIWTVISDMGGQSARAKRGDVLELMYLINNVKSSNSNIGNIYAPKPDLTVQGFNTKITQDGYKVEAIVRNVGTADSDRPVEIKWYFNGDLIGAGSYGPHRIGATRAEYSNNTELDFIVGEKLPGNISSRILTAGNHTIRYCVNTNDDIEELNKNNNCSQTTLRFYPRSARPKIYIQGGSFDINNRESRVTICSENIPGSNSQVFDVIYRVTRNGAFVKTQKFRGNQPTNRCRESGISASQGGSAGLGLPINSNYTYEIYAILELDAQNNIYSNTFMLDVNN